MSSRVPFLPLLDVFGDPAVAEIFGAERYYKRCVEVEVALAQAEAAVGIVPPEAAEAISRGGCTVALPLEEIKQKTRVVGYPIVPVVHVLASAVPGEGGEWVHFGATTQDIMDTALVLQLREAHARVHALVTRTGDALASLAESHAATSMAARTHAQQAVPTTFGLKVAVWLDEFDRHLLRLDRAAAEMLRVQLAGAGGTLASLGDHAPAVRAELSRRLGLGPPSTPWHTARDGIGAYAAVLALLCATCGKIAREIIDLSRDEIGEVTEAHQSLRGSSSTMPQKRNPIGSETVIGLSSLGCALHGAFARAMQPGHERAAGEWQIEWDAVPLLFATTAGGLLNLSEVLETLVVHPERMDANLKRSSLIMSEAVMMALAPHIGRQRAHDVVYAIAQRALHDGTSLAEVLAGSGDLREAGLIDTALAALEPSNYLGEAQKLAREAAARWRQNSDAAHRTAPEFVQTSAG